MSALKKVKGWLARLSEAQSPYWLTLVAALTGLACVIMTVVAAVYAVKLSEWTMFPLFAGLAVYCSWATLALCNAALSPRLGLGTRLTLVAFLFGAILTLFESPAHVLRGDLAAITPWQGVFWVIGAVLATVGLERERRAKKVDAETPPATA